MGCRNRDMPGISGGDIARVPLQLEQHAREHKRLCVEMHPRRGQRHAVGAAREQGRTHPCLQRANSAAEGGLGDVTRLCGPGKIQGIGKGEIIFQPGQIH